MDVTKAILAAGNSIRMGSQKMLINIEKTPILSKVIEIAGGKKSSQEDSYEIFPETSILIVLGADFEETSKIALKYQNIVILKNEKYNEGIAESLKTAVRNVPKNANGLMVFLGDMPFVKEETIALLLKAFARDALENLLYIPKYNETRGNPVIIRRELFSEILTLTGDRGASSLFEKYKEKIMHVEVNDIGILKDIDTKEDL